VIHELRNEKENRFSKIENLSECMDEIHQVLILKKEDASDYTTLNKSFDRFKNVCLACVTARKCEATPTVRGRRWEPSQLVNHTIETMKVTALTDTATLALLDVQYHAR